MLPKTLARDLLRTNESVDAVFQSPGFDNHFRRAERRAIGMLPNRQTLNSRSLARTPILARATEQSGDDRFSWYFHVSVKPEPAHFRLIVRGHSNHAEFCFRFVNAKSFNWLSSSLTNCSFLWPICASR